MAQVVLKAKDRTLPGFEESDRSTKWDSPFYFIQAADPQLGLISNYGDGTIKDQYPNVTWEEEIKLCTQSVDVINRLKPRPKFFIVCGDLLDAMPADWPEIRKRQEEDFMKIYANLDKEIPLVCVCGNHDIGNTPTRDTIESYRSSFGDDYFSFWVAGVHFLVLNSQFYEDSSKVPELAKAQEKWLDEQLAHSQKIGRKHLILFQHIPWFVKKPDEDKIYFNIEAKLREEMMQKFSKAGVRKIFCGHHHRNGGGWYKDVELIVTTAIGCQIGDDTHGMRIVKVKEDKVEHEFHSLKDFPRDVV